MRNKGYVMRDEFCTMLITQYEFFSILTNPSSSVNSNVQMHNKC